MADTRTLELRTTDDDKVHATVSLQGDSLVITGAKSVRDIIDSIARNIKGSDIEAFEYLWRNGWTNGPVSLAPMGSENE